MTTDNEQEMVPWGRRVRTVVYEVAVFFRDADTCKALEDAQSWANDNNGRIESAHGILKQRCKEPFNGPSWGLFTANYEEDTGLDIEGRIGRKGKPVLVAIQGGGIMLSSPQRMKDAYENRTSEERPSIRQDEITHVLAGKLPNGQAIKVYTLDQLAKEYVEELPQTYAIAVPLRDIEGTPAISIPVDRLPKNKMLIITAGHPETAREYAAALKKVGIKKYSILHGFDVGPLPKQPSGCVLSIENNEYALFSFKGLDFNPRPCFVGVRWAGDKSAPQQGANHPLEQLIGLGTPVGQQGLVVVDGNKLTPEAYSLLTGQIRS